jgi:hypothetical protein
MPLSKAVTADEQTLHYLAGVFDGEGCVSVSIQKKNTCLLSVTVVMTDRQAIDLFYDVFGGSFVVKNDPTKNGKSKNVFSWRIYNAEAVAALDVFAARCRVKQVVAQKGLMLARRFSPNAIGAAVSLEEKKARLSLMIEIRELVGRSSLDQNKIESFLKQRHNGAKAVVSENGMKFNSQSEAARFLGVHTTAINSAILKGHKCSGTHWRIVHDN